MVKLKIHAILRFYNASKVRISKGFSSVFARVLGDLLLARSAVLPAGAPRPWHAPKAGALPVGRHLGLNYYI